jgi:hypothetical protein
MIHFGEKFIKRSIFTNKKTMFLYKYNVTFYEYKLSPEYKQCFLYVPYLLYVLY